MRTRTSTRAGRDGDLSERKSRTGARWSQNGHPSRSAGDTGPQVSATGASQRLQASVPIASSPERVTRRCSSTGPADRVAGCQRKESESSMPRRKLTETSLGRAPARDDPAGVAAHIVVAVTAEDHIGALKPATFSLPGPPLM